MSEILRISSVVWCLIHVLVSFLIFYVPRYSWKKSLVLILAFLGPLCALNVELFLEMGKTVYSQSLALVLMLPIFILFFVLSKHRDFRFVFTFCVVNTISAELIILSILIDELLTPRMHIALFLVRLLSFPIIECLAIRKIRTAYFELQSAVKKGWGIFALMSFLFYVMLLVFASYPNLIIDRPEDIPAMMLLLLL
ncbi:MAG: hypothetical protein IJA58_02330, partial [Lachnospiraceae bacterium]|nr:hypothetical protein [Lachnospiraceae bacterium]